MNIQCGMPSGNIQEVTALGVGYNTLHNAGQDMETRHPQNLGGVGYHKSKWVELAEYKDRDSYSLLSSSLGLKSPRTLVRHTSVFVGGN